MDIEQVKQNILDRVKDASNEELWTLIDAYQMLIEAQASEVHNVQPFVFPRNPPLES